MGLAATNCREDKTTPQQTETKLLKQPEKDETTTAESLRLDVVIPGQDLDRELNYSSNAVRGGG